MKDFLQRNLEAALLLSTALGFSIGMLVCYLTGDDSANNLTDSDYRLETAHEQSQFFRSHVGLNPDMPEFDKNESFFELNADILKEMTDNYDYLSRTGEPEGMKTARVYMVQDSQDDASETHFVMVGLRSDRTEISKLANATGAEVSGYRRITNRLPCPRACERNEALYKVITGRE